MYLYKDVRDSVKGANPKSSFPLDGFYGLESGICYDKETSVLAIICHKHIVLFAFDSRETLIQFEIKIRRSLGEGMTRINLGVVASKQLKKTFILM